MTLLYTVPLPEPGITIELHPALRVGWIDIIVFFVQAVSITTFTTHYRRKYLFKDLESLLDYTIPLCKTIALKKDALTRRSVSKRGAQLLRFSLSICLTSRRLVERCSDHGSCWHLYFFLQLWLDVLVISIVSVKATDVVRM